MSNERDIFDRNYKEKRNNEIAKNQKLTSNLISSINSNLLQLNNQEDVQNEENIGSDNGDNRTSIWVLNY